MVTTFTNLHLLTVGPLSLFRLRANHVIDYLNVVLHLMSLLAQCVPIVVMFTTNKINSLPHSHAQRLQYVIKHLLDDTESNILFIASG